jgi:hypothetical protein
MRLLALLLLVGVAQAQGLTQFAPGQVSGGKAVATFGFATPGCYASGTSGVNITRATVATYVDGSSNVQTCASGEYRVSPDGIVVEPSRSNYVLNATTHAKSTEATGTLPAGACVGWHDGTGNMTIAAGTATVTGLSCAAVAPGTLCTFTVTVGGTMAITTAAGVTRAQIECTGSYRTSFIPTAGAPVTRNADAVTVTIPSLSPKWCIAGTWKALTSSWVNAMRPWSLGTNANSAYLSGVYFGIFDATITQKYLGTYTTPTTGVAHRIIACSVSGTMSLSIDGSLSGAAVTGSTGIIATPPTTLSVGSDSGGANQFSGAIKDLQVWKISSKASEAR